MLHPKQLLPLPSQGILRDPHWHIWGGGVVSTPDGIYHLLIARWPKERGFNAWVTHSEITYATAPAPGGPYTIHHSVLGPRPGNWWDADNCHNPMPMAYNNKFYCYYTGNYGNGDWWTHRNHQRIGVAVAEHPSGPWRRLDRPLLDTTPGSWDHLITSSPIVACGGDGRFYMVYKGVSEGPLPFGGQVRMGLAIAEKPEGPFIKQPGNFFDSPGFKFPSDDNYLWFANGRFHAIVKDLGGHFQTHAKEALVLFTSSDCRNWQPSSNDPTLCTFHFQHADGHCTGPVRRLDQPQLICNADGHPCTLLLAVKERDDNDNGEVSYNIQIPLAPH
ncbi:MAG: glycoside hydrolase family protein [Phycisphaerae bacterium]